MARELTIKIKADGTQARQELRDTERQIEGVEGATQDVDRAMTTMGANSTRVVQALGAAIAAAQIGEQFRKAMDAASGIADQAAKIGISAEAVQRLGFAASQSGSSIESVATAITRMGANLTEGSKPTVEALARLGLDLDKIKTMRPEDAFTAIADAIQKVPDPMQQSADAMAIFGRGGAELLPAIKAGISEIGAQAPLMSDAMVESGDKIGDSWDKMQARFTALQAQALFPLANFFITQIPEGVQVAAAGVMAFIPSIEQLGIAIIAAGGPTAAMAGLKAAGVSLAAFFTTTLPAAFTAIIAFLGPQGLIALAVVALGLVWYKWGDDITAIVKKVYGAVKEWLIDKFTGIVSAVGDKVNAITGFFGDMYDKVVGNSYVPDMVDAIGLHFGRLDDVMVRPTVSATATMETAFSNALNRVGDGLSKWTSTVLPSFGSQAKGFMGGLMGSLNDLMTGGMNSLISVGLSLAIEGVKKIGGAIKGLFQSEESKHVNKPRDQFFAQFGGYDGLANDLTQTMISLGVGDAGNSAHRMINSLNDADTESLFKTAQQSIIDVFASAGRHVQGFAQGTMGQYRDFKAGTLVELHGKERVMTESEGRAEASAMHAVRDEVAALRRQMRSQSRDMVRAVTLGLTNARALRT